MIRKIVWNQIPESLGDVAEADFVDAFENKIRVDPRLRECEIEVTFVQQLHSGIDSVTADSTDEEMEALYRGAGTLQDALDQMAQRAWEHCSA